MRWVNFKVKQIKLSPFFSCFIIISSLTLDHLVASCTKHLDSFISSMHPLAFWMLAIILCLLLYPFTFSLVYFYPSQSARYIFFTNISLHSFNNMSKPHQDCCFLSKNSVKLFWSPHLLLILLLHKHGISVPKFHEVTCSQFFCIYLIYIYITF